MTRLNKNSSHPGSPHLFLFPPLFLIRLDPLCPWACFFFSPNPYLRGSSVWVSFSVSVSCSLSVPPSVLIERLCTAGAERKEKLDNDTRQYCVENLDLSYRRLHPHTTHTCSPSHSGAFFIWSTHRTRFHTCAAKITFISSPDGCNSTLKNPNPAVGISSGFVSCVFSSVSKLVLRGSCSVRCSRSDLWRIGSPSATVKEKYLNFLCQYVPFFPPLFRDEPERLTPLPMGLQTTEQLLEQDVSSTFSINIFYAFYINRKVDMKNATWWGFLDFYISG